ncbi:M20/M25/M40 family metallo-hydrolase [Svornostia abyssi]|uniref:M20/M25/M40 family metallo-hydrolase n=1 Tax=Svornostia abyssi TaxID=2898438 RepID=A0ABY5P9Z6_9ACTN|nr:M20/M25/M40 family metallo-hydrolase [Parviterribacteraceae bacterium J379]
MVRGLECTYAERSRQPATALDAGVADALADAARAEGAEPLRLVSGAAHDTMVLAPRVPSAMLFIPCAGGVSHDPAEAADPDDAALAARVVARAARDLIGAQHG